jgi:outer membrane protein OmpA-like peptidoglycan-associated protein
MNDKRHALCLASLLLAGAHQVQAGGVRMYQSGEIPQAGEVADILTGGAVMNRPKMRGISLDSVREPAVQKGPNLEKVAQPTDTVVGLAVKFAFNSAQILPENEPQLDAVAQGIKMTDGIRVVVEGHTDAYGPEAYNDRLSRERAEAVKNYLISKHGISASLLTVEGLGSKAPINASDPYAAENRRVQLRAAN